MSRYSLIPDAATWTEQFGVSPLHLPESYRKPRYNIGRGQLVPVLRPAGSQRELTLMHWGFLPHWVRASARGAPAFEPLTVRADQLPLPYFRDAFRYRRCLLPASGYYGWQGWENGPGLPFHVRLVSRLPFLVAAIWDSWGTIDRVAIATTAANDRLQPIHDRMPAIIPPDQADAWLHGADPAALLHPYPSERMELYTVGRKLFCAGSDGPELIEPVLDRPPVQPAA
jgi:putative SOS response-associated peptidase YedK